MASSGEKGMVAMTKATRHMPYSMMLVRKPRMSFLLKVTPHFQWEYHSNLQSLFIISHPFGYLNSKNRLFPLADTVYPDVKKRPTPHKAASASFLYDLNRRSLWCNRGVNRDDLFSQSQRSQGSAARYQYMPPMSPMPGAAAGVFYRSICCSRSCRRCSISCWTSWMSSSKSPETLTVAVVSIPSK